MPDFSRTSIWPVWRTHRHQRIYRSRSTAPSYCLLLNMQLIKNLVFPTEDGGRRKVFVRAARSRKIEMVESAIQRNIRNCRRKEKRLRDVCFLFFTRWKINHKQLSWGAITALLYLTIMFLISLLMFPPTKKGKNNGKVKY